MTRQDIEKTAAALESRLETAEYEGDDTAATQAMIGLMEIETTLRLGPIGDRDEYGEIAWALV